AIVVRNRRRGIGSNNVTCGEPPSTLGDLVLYTKQQDAAFYVCPGENSIYIDLPLNCPILYCQANRTFSTLENATFQSYCSPVNGSQTVVNTSGTITSPNYPGSYFPTLTNTDFAWSIMTPGSNLVFRIEDFNVDKSTGVVLFCGV
ncbi:hypothetical protein ACJMK2_029329, partial [Sinanodonta woodiana]